MEDKIIGNIILHIAATQYFSLISAPTDVDNAGFFFRKVKF
jgi:hypothetical protein